MTGARRLPIEGGARARSTAGRAIYAVGAVHGRYDRFAALLEAIVADLAAAPAGPTPLLVFCGDLIDRGPEAPEVLAALVWLSRRAPAEVRVLRGAQEAAMLGFLDRPETLHTWLAIGGEATLQAYGVPPGNDAAVIRDALVDRLPASHLALLRAAAAETHCGDYVFGGPTTRTDRVLVHPGDAPASRRALAIAPGARAALRLEGASAEWLEAGAAAAATYEPPLPDEPPPPAESAEVVTMRDALARLRPGY